MHGVYIRILSMPLTITSLPSVKRVTATSCKQPFNQVFRLNSLRNNDDLQVSTRLIEKLCDKPDKFTFKKEYQPLNSFDFSAG